MRYKPLAIVVIIVGLATVALLESYSRFSAQTTPGSAASSSSSASSFIEPIPPITDVEWHSLEGSAVYFLFTRNVIQGYPDRTFRGNELVSRAELAKMLILAGGIPITHTENKGRFHDIAEGEWYTPFVLTAAAKGIVEGFPTQRILFKPSLSVNTAEFLKMLTRTFNLHEGMPQSYTDVPGKIWYEPFAGVAWQYELLPLRPVTFLQPHRFLTRREVAIAIDLLFHQPQRRRLPQWKPPIVPVLPSIPFLPPPGSSAPSPPGSSSTPGGQNGTIGLTGGATTTGGTATPTGGTTEGTTGTTGTSSTTGTTGMQGTVGPFGGPTGGTTGEPSSSSSASSSTGGGTGITVPPPSSSSPSSSSTSQPGDKGGGMVLPP